MTGRTRRKIYVGKKRAKRLRLLTSINIAEGLPKIADLIRPFPGGFESTTFSSTKPNFKRLKTTVTEDRTSKERKLTNTHGDDHQNEND